MGIIVIWYKYALYYNHKNLSGIFLTGIYPIWDLDNVAIKNNWVNLRTDLLPAYFNKKALYIILLLFITLFFFFKKVNKRLFYLTILVFLGTIAYLILFYKAFTVHDYYLVNLLIFIPLPLITMLELLKRNYVRIYRMKFLKILFACVVSLVIYETAIITRAKYSVNDRFVKTNFVVSKGYIDQWAWHHWDYANHFKAYETITPYLRKIGLQRNDRVLSLPDRSINISLYLMDQKGFTAFGYEDMSFDQRMQLYKRNGVQFLIADTAYYNKNQYLDTYIQSKIGSYMNLDVYELK